MFLNWQSKSTNFLPIFMDHFLWQQMGTDIGSQNERKERRGFLSYLQNSTANSAHQAAHFCIVLVCPQKAQNLEK